MIRSKAISLPDHDCQDCKVDCQGHASFQDCEVDCVDCRVESWDMCPQASVSAPDDAHSPSDSSTPPSPMLDVRRMLRILGGGLSKSGYSRSSSCSSSGSSSRSSSAAAQQQLQLQISHKHQQQQNQPKQHNQQNRAQYAKTNIQANK